MFKSIQLVNNIGFNYYVLEDTDFRCQSSACSEDGMTLDVIREYKARNLPVAKNLSLYYIYLKDKKYPINAKWLINDMRWLDNYFVRFNYGIKYYPCVLGYIRKAQYARPKLGIL